MRKTAKPKQRMTIAAQALLTRSELARLIWAVPWIVEIDRNSSNSFIFTAGFSSESIYKGCEVKLMYPLCLYLYTYNGEYFTNLLQSFWQCQTILKLQILPTFYAKENLLMIFSWKTFAYVAPRNNHKHFPCSKTWNNTRERGRVPTQQTRTQKDWYPIIPTLQEDGK